MNEPVYTYRLATTDDAEALQAIYAPYVDTSITFECTCPDVDEFRKRIEERICLYPYIVCEEDGVPVGYAYASRLFTREAYAWAVELSVYLSKDCRGRGLGRALYDRLLTLLEMQGVRSAQAAPGHGLSSGGRHGQRGLQAGPVARRGALRKAPGRFRPRARTRRPHPSA